VAGKIVGAVVDAEVEAQFVDHVPARTRSFLFKVFEVAFFARALQASIGCGSIEAEALRHISHGRAGK